MAECTIDGALIDRCHTINEGRRHRLAGAAESGCNATYARSDVSCLSYYYRRRATGYAHPQSR